MEPQESINFIFVESALLVEGRSSTENCGSPTPLHLRLEAQYMKIVI